MQYTITQLCQDFCVSSSSLFDCPGSQRSFLCIPNEWCDLIPLLSDGEKQTHWAPGSGGVNEAQEVRRKLLSCWESLSMGLTQRGWKWKSPSQTGSTQSVQGGLCKHLRHLTAVRTPLLCVVLRCTRYNIRLPPKSFRIRILMSTLLRCQYF